MNVSQFKALSEKCLEAVHRVCPGVRCEVVPSYFSKTSFGDLDLLVSKEGFDQEKVAGELSACEVFRQKNAIYCSMGVRLDELSEVFQVDFIEESLSAYDFAMSYYAFNDLGNLLGILVAKQGLKLKHNGLYYYLRNGTEVLGEVLVSLDFEQVLGFLGLNVNRYNGGFESLTDLFQFVASSECFDPELYLLENRNHRSRTRDRKRPTYQAFLTYCKDNPKVGYQPRGDLDWLQRAYSFFPDLADKVKAVEQDAARSKTGRSLFNGELVHEVTGLQGKALGDFLRHLSATQDYFGLQNAVSSGEVGRVRQVVQVAFAQYLKTQSF